MDISSAVRLAAPVLPDLAAERKAASEAKKIRDQDYQDAIATYQAQAAEYGVTSDERIAILHRRLLTSGETMMFAGV